MEDDSGVLCKRRVAGRELGILYVKAHVGNKGNGRTDKLVKLGSN